MGLFSGASFAFAAPTPTLTAPASLKEPIYFESESLEYRQAEQVIVATGNVKVQQTSYTFYSDFAYFDIPHKFLEAWGTVRFEDRSGNQIRSRLLSYNSENGSATLNDAEGSFGPWLFATQKVERDLDGNFTLSKAKLSTCEKDLSKYHLYGHKIRVMPGKRLTVQHALFRIGPVPVLYLPYYYYSLGEKHLSFQIFPGHNQSEGIFVRTIWGYPVTDETYLRIYLDALTRRGWGTGGEFNYYADTVKGSFYGYRIDDRITDRNRWNARLYHWQQVTPSLTLQSNANKLSDDSFPNDFFREDFNRVVRDFRSSVALTKGFKGAYLRLFAERQEAFNVLENQFFNKESFAPKVEFTHLQSPIGFLGIEKILSASFANRFAGQSAFLEPLNRFYRRESDAQLTLLRRFRLARPTMLIPRVSVKNSWIDRPQGMEPSETWVQRGQLDTTLRQRIGYSVDVDLTHSINQRLQANRGDDQGREVHNLGFLATVQPNSAVYLRLNTSHNLPRAKGEPLAFLERKNYAPLGAEISYTPRHNLEMFFREEYLLHDPNTDSAHPLSTQSELIIGDRSSGRNYFMFGTSYLSSRDDALELRQGLRWTPFSWLELEGLLRSWIFFRGQNFVNVKAGESFEKEAKIKSGWRCWDFAFTFRERKGVYEFVFNIELQLERATREKDERRGQESEMYPWRAYQ